MANLYRAVGTRLSFHSVKVRAYFRCKAIPHQWLLRNASSERHPGYAAVPDKPARGLIPDAAACLAGLPA